MFQFWIPERSPCYVDILLVQEVFALSRWFIYSESAISFSSGLRTKSFIKLQKDFIYLVLIPSTLQTDAGLLPV